MTDRSPKREKIDGNSGQNSVQNKPNNTYQSEAKEETENAHSFNLISSLYEKSYMHREQVKFVHFVTE